MTTNRLPPVRHHVTGCASCPLAGWSNNDSDASLKCQHPDVPERDVLGEEGVPDFCPLLRAPLLLALAPEAP